MSQNEQTSRKLIVQGQLQMVTLFVKVPLVEIYDFATNEFATSCDYLTFTTTVDYIYNYCLHLKSLATTL
jgi:hypothetical protein